MTTVTTDETSYEHTLGHRWRPLALAGGVVGLIGIVAVAFPLATGLSIATGLGVLLALSGVVHGVHAFTVHGWSGRLWQAALAVVSVLAGLFLLANPVLTLVSLTALLVGYLLVDGVTELWMALRMADRPGRASVAVSGLLSFVLAGLLWAGFPTDAAWAVGALVGIGLVVTGLSMVLVALAGRNADAAQIPAEPQNA